MDQEVQDYHKRLGKTIARLRKSSPGGTVSQSEVAKKAGIAQGYLSRIENGKVPVSIEVLAHICYAMNLPVTEVLLETEVGSLDLDRYQRGLLDQVLGLLDRIDKMPTTEEIEDNEAQMNLGAYI